MIIIRFFLLTTDNKKQFLAFSELAPSVYHGQCCNKRCRDCVHVPFSLLFSKAAGVCDYVGREMAKGHRDEKEKKSAS